jgi:hypothetical protein
MLRICESGRGAEVGAPTQAMLRGTEFARMSLSERESPTF